MTMYKPLPPRDDIGRLYAKKREWKRTRPHWVLSWWDNSRSREIRKRVVPVAFWILITFTYGLRIIYNHHHHHHAISTDIPDPLSPFVSIVHRFRLVFYATCSISTERLYIGSSKSPSHFSSVWRSPQEYITYESVLISPVVSHISCLSNSDGFRGR